MYIKLAYTGGAICCDAFLNVIDNDNNEILEKRLKQGGNGSRHSLHGDL